MTSSLIMQAAQPSQASLVQLIDEHLAIERAVARMRTLVSVSVPDIEAVIASLRCLSIELGDHLAHEDSFLYPMLADANKPAARDTAASFIAEFATLCEDWTLYLREWTDDCIMADWGMFAAATHDLLDRLDLRVERENSLLYPRAFRDGFIGLRAQ